MKPLRFFLALSQLTACVCVGQETGAIPFVNGGLTIPSGKRTNNRGTILQQTVPGNTHMEAYLFWRLLEPARDQWNLREFDEMLELCRPRNLKMLVLPWVMYAPDWFKQTADYQPVVNLKTGLATDMLSPWAPGTDAAFDHFYSALAARYGREISIIKLGYPGSDFGEVGLWIGGKSFLPGGNFHEFVPQDPATWTTGSWCADRFAKADFREQMLRKYGGVVQLNAAWQTQFLSPETIEFPDPDHREGLRLRWIDFIEWIRDSQVRNLSRLLRIIRKHFPTTLLDIPLGFGSDLPSDGCDRTAICRAAAEFKPINIRSTHASVNRDRFPRAYWFYKRMAPVCHELGIGFGTEPPGGDVKTAELRRQMFEDASAGASFIFHYFQNYHQLPDVVGEYQRLLRPGERPLVDIGVLYPTTQMILDMSHHPEGQIEFCANGREFFDYDLVDENMIEWGMLKNYKVLLHTSGSVFREQALQGIATWLQQGGILITRGNPGWENEAGPSDTPRLWFANEEPAPVQGIRAHRIGKGHIYAAAAGKIADYLPQTVAIVTAAAKSPSAPVHGFDGKEDGRLVTDFPSGQLRFDTATLQSEFVPATQVNGPRGPKLD